MCLLKESHKLAKFWEANQISDVAFLGEKNIHLMHEYSISSAGYDWYLVKSCMSL